MRVLRNILLVAVVLLTFNSCNLDYDDKELMSQVRFVIELPDGDGDGEPDVCESAVAMAGSFISEYNTRDKFTFGTFRNNVASVELPKGVYTFMLDATIYFSDGTVRNARNTDYSQPANALHILEDSKEVKLKMNYLY